MVASFRFWVREGRVLTTVRSTCPFRVLRGSVGECLIWGTPLFNAQWQCKVMAGTTGPPDQNQSCVLFLDFLPIDNTVFRYNDVQLRTCDEQLCGRVIGLAAACLRYSKCGGAVNRSPPGDVLVLMVELRPHPRKSGRDWIQVGYVLCLFCCQSSGRKMAEAVVCIHCPPDKLYDTASHRCPLLNYL